MPDKTPPSSRSRSGVIAAVVIGAIVLVLVALHIVGAMALHGS